MALLLQLPAVHAKKKQQPGSTAWADRTRVAVARYMHTARARKVSLFSCAWGRAHRMRARGIVAEWSCLSRSLWARVDGADEDAAEAPRCSAGLATCVRLHGTCAPHACSEYWRRNGGSLRRPHRWCSLQKKCRRTAWNARKDASWRAAMRQCAACVAASLRRADHMCVVDMHTACVLGVLVAVWRCFNSSLRCTHAGAACGGKRRSSTACHCSAAQRCLRRRVAAQSRAAQRTAAHHALPAAVGAPHS